MVRTYGNDELGVPRLLPTKNGGAARWDGKRGPWQSCWCVETGGGAFVAVDFVAAALLPTGGLSRERGSVAARGREGRANASEREWGSAVLGLAT